MKKRYYLLILISINLLVTGARGKEKSDNVLVILNSSSPGYGQGKEYIIPYLDHFGVPYTTIDVHNERLPQSLIKYDLLIIAQKQIEVGIEGSIKPHILNAVKAGTGLISFDFHFALQAQYQPVEYKKVKDLYFSKSGHYISSAHELSEKLTLFGEISLPKISTPDENVILGDSGHPLLTALQEKKGRIVVWTSLAWIQASVLGPLGGLDDCFWRSLVWAARKPFAFRGLPPIVTMRVDDVAGRGQIFDRSPLYWVKTANKFGWKPYLALFIYNLNPDAITELRGYLLEGQATAAPHAFGRPPRTEMPNFKSDYFTENIDPNYYEGLYYYQKGLPYRLDRYDEFIFFDWAQEKAWLDSEAERGLQAVDKWYEKHRPLPMSNYLVPHWYELGANVIPHIVDKWHMEFIGIVMEPGASYSIYTPWLKAAPFRLYEEPGASAFSKELLAERPVYYADFLQFGERKLFNCVTEIRDNAGYEWAPDNDVEATANRGIQQLRRALNSMALAVLFTHETDYIYKIQPENWNLELKKITEGIVNYDPVYMSMDEALIYVRAVETSKFESYHFDSERKYMQANFTGSTDVLTHYYLFTEDSEGIHSQLVEISPFNDGITIQAEINKEDTR